MSKRVLPRLGLAADVQDFDGAFDRAFALIAFAINRHLVDHMLRSSRLLTDGDYEALVIWGVLAHQNVMHLMPPGTVPSAHLAENGRVDADFTKMRPVTTSSLASICGIPRETVRRKLEALGEQHYVSRVKQGWVVSETRMEPDLREFTRETTLRLLAVAEEVKSAMADAELAKASRSRQREEP